MEPRTGREHRQILLFSRVLTLNEQEAASGDAERVRFVVGHLAMCSRGTAHIDLDSHDRHSFVRGRICITCHGTPAVPQLSAAGGPLRAPSRSPGAEVPARMRTFPPSVPAGSRARPSPYGAPPGRSIRRSGHFEGKFIHAPRI